MSTRKNKAPTGKKSTRAARKGSPYTLRHGFRAGDRILVLDVPPNFKVRGHLDDPEMRTAELFHFCVGRKFAIRGFDRYGHIELRPDDDPAVKKEFGLNSIWLEPELVKLISKTRRKVNRPESGFGWKEDFLAENRMVEAQKRNIRPNRTKREK